MIEPEPYIKKKLRSKRSRLPRSKLSPVLLRGGGDIVNRGLSTISVDSSSCCYFADEVSSNLRKRKFSQEIGANETKKNIEEDEMSFRRITRSYCKQQKEKERKRVESEASETSCVLSNGGAIFGETSCKSKKRIENVKKFEPDGNSRSDNSSVDQISVRHKTLQSGAGNLKPSSENDVISLSYGVKSYSVSKQSEKRGELKLELSAVSNNDAVDSNFTASNSECVVEQKPRSIKFDSDLVCSEQLSYDDDDVSEYSSSHENVLAERYYAAFPDDSDLDFSDYTPSIFLESGSEFSERSIDDSSPPSRTQSLLIEFGQQFSRSTFSLDSKKLSLGEEDNQNQSRFLRFSDEEDEESYQRFLDRERRQIYLHDYIEEYLSTTEYGDLILQQRSQMVHWIVEQCDAKRFQQETLFLGVGLLDRFLSRGFFKTERNLQIVGIACLALATRIEENQPYNSVRQKNFKVGINIYSRCEVVAMEWLVQEVLNFRCLLPTIYNFLWFYLKAARADAEVEKMAKYLAVLALSDHEQLCYWPSTVAAGVVILASLECHQDKSLQRVVEIHTRTKDNGLPDCIKSLEWLVQYVS